MQTTSIYLRCELCGAGYERPSDLKGICRDCCQHLGGGRYSCAGMQAEVKGKHRQIDKRRRWK
jgi:hypothetical protein